MVKELFEKHENEGLKFEDIKNKRSNRPDLHAFLLLDELFPSSENIIAESGHDMLWLGIGDDEVTKLTDEQICELVCCGIFYDTEFDCLAMFA